MTCRSMLGSPFRATFRRDGAPHFEEVLLCPTHEREADELKAKFPEHLLITQEGWVVSGLVLNALGFLT